ncbi:unannotated protein [freshwater metagenome]|uniref:Unannotated protein n=1 Tax=freshwater metagenome TaxID=449393 RepID=A0A6J6WPP4_9ZZZZ
MAKTFLIAFDLFLSARYWRSLVRRGQTVLVERYVYDLIVDPFRLGVSACPLMIRKAIVHAAMRPSRVILCVAPPAEIEGRKGELTVAEVSRQYAIWDLIQRWLPLERIVTSAGADTEFYVQALGL